jgi:hypothetical protein
LEEFRKIGIRLPDKLKIFPFSLISPMPRILKGCDLGVGIMSGRRRIKDIVISFGIEWRIEIDQINGIVLEVVTISENLQIVTVI